MKTKMYLFLLIITVLLVNGCTNLDRNRVASENQPKVEISKAKAFATASLLNMNVIYIGVDNPISISVQGSNIEKIVPSIDHGKIYLDPTNDTYIIRIDQLPKNDRMVQLTVKDNAGTTIGSFNYKVKRVPTPSAEIAGQMDGKIDKNQLLAAGAIVPNMRDFEFELYYEITGYTFATIINGDWIPKVVRGNRFTDEIQEIIRNGKRKQKFFFMNIQAKGPEGSVRSLNPINLELN